MTKNRNPIAEAVEPRRAAAVERAVEHAKGFIGLRLQDLEVAGWDLNKVAPRPQSNMSRRSYQMAKNRRAMFEHLTADANPKAENSTIQSQVLWKRHRNEAPDLRAKDQAGCDHYVEQARRDADAEFSAYISKLTAKVTAADGPGVVSAELDSGNLWTFSHLTVKFSDGSVERWRTQMILNVSVLGTLFNQWPTRRVK